MNKDHDDDDDDDDKSVSLTVRIKLLSELKSTLLGKLFHVGLFTTRSLKNLLREGVGKIETRPQLFGYCLNAQRQKISG